MMIFSLDFKKMQSHHMQKVKSSKKLGDNKISSSRLNVVALGLWSFLSVVGTAPYNFMAILIALKTISPSIVP